MNQSLLELENRLHRIVIFAWRKMMAGFIYLFMEVTDVTFFIYQT